MPSPRGRPTIRVREKLCVVSSKLVAAPPPAALGVAKRNRLALIIFRIVVLIARRAAAAARVLVLLLGKLPATFLLTPLIGLIALLVGIVYAATLLAALLLTLRLRHRMFLTFVGKCQH